MRGWRWWATLPEANQALALIGVGIVLLQALFIAETRIQLSTIVLGVVINQIGVWNLGSRLLRDPRVYNLLRAEVDGLISLVRKLNRKAVAGAAKAVEETKRELLDSVERISRVAGVVGKGAVDPESGNGHGSRP